MNFGPFQTLEVPFDKDANITPLGPIDGSGAQAALVALAPAIDDLIVISHGWNNDVDDARTLYAAIFASVANAWSTAGLTPADQAKTAILALYWPSKRFDEADLIPGGAAAVQDPVPVDYGAKIAAQIANLKDAFGQFGPAQQALLDRALAQVPLLDTEAGQNAYVAALAALFPATTGEADPGLDSSKSGLAERSGADVLADIQTQLGLAPAAAAATGGAESIGDDAPMVTQAWRRASIRSRASNKPRTCCSTSPPTTS